MAASPGFKSILEDHPEHLKAIGLVTVEVNNMEMALAQLLAKILGVGPDIAGAIYFTPRGQIPRVEMMMNVVQIAFAKDQYNLSQIKSALLRAKTVMGKRHKIIHDSWGTTEDGNILRTSYPMKQGTENSTLTPLKTLNALVDDTRKLITDLTVLVFALPHAKLPPYPGIHVGPTPPGSPK